MKTRMNQLGIQVLLIMVIAAIVAYTCVNLAELVGIFSDAVKELLSGAKWGF